MRGERGPGFRIDDYAGAYVGFAAGSAMLWIGAGAFTPPPSLPRWMLELAGAAVAGAALAFGGAGVLEAPPERGRLLRLVYAAALTGGGVLLFAQTHRFGSLLAAVGLGTAASTVSRRAISTAVGAWCTVVAAAALLPGTPVPVAARLLHAPWQAALLAAVGLTAAAAPAALRRPAIVAMCAAIAVLSTGMIVSHGLTVWPYVIWPGMGALAAGAYVEKPIVWSHSLRGILARSTAFVAVAAIWLLASAEAAVSSERNAAAILLAMAVATLAIVGMSAKFAERIARPMRELRAKAERIAEGEAVGSIRSDNEELTSLSTTLSAVSRIIRSRNLASTLAHGLTLDALGVRDTHVVRTMAERAVAAYFGVPGCARIVPDAPAAHDDATCLALRSAHARLEVRVPAVIDDDDRRALELLADTADLVLGSSALLRSLGEDRRLLDNIYASVPVGIVLIDADGRVVRANDAALRLLGVPREREITGEPIAAHLGTSELHDGRLRVDDGGRAVELLVRPDADGGRSLVVLRDLTEQEALEGLKSEFMAAVSHDLRTPLTAIKGFAVLLQERVDLDGEVREILALIDRAANRLGRMIDDLMQTALVDAGRLTLLIEPVALGAVLRGLGALAGESAAHQLVMEVPAELSLLADRDRLEQVLVNLVVNAYKYAARGRVFVRAHAAGADRVEIAVSDDGPGIDAAEQERIFEKFYQARRQGVRRRGVGLGLYISRALVERMGGTLGVRSTPGFGATFVISLPSAATSARRERSA